MSVPESFSGLSFRIGEIRGIISRTDIIEYLKQSGMNSTEIDNIKASLDVLIEKVIYKVK